MANKKAMVCLRLGIITTGTYTLLKKTANARRIELKYQSLRQKSK